MANLNFMTSELLPHYFIGRGQGHVHYFDIFGLHLSRATISQKNQLPISLS